MTALVLVPKEHQAVAELRYIYYLNKIGYYDRRVIIDYVSKL